MLAGCAAVLIGAALLMHLPVGALLRMLLVGMWTGGGVMEIGRITRGVRRTRMILLTTEGAAIIDGQGRRQPAWIMSGTVVLPRLAWLRLKLADGLVYGELIRGNAASCRQWRRLQILWRLGPRAFGGQS